jgi:acyl-CoA thioesterase
MLTSFSDILAGIAPREDGFVVAVAENWRQGRTLYGGISAALCVECAMRSVSDLPPLRSAQFSFIAPVVGEVRIVPSVLRRGKTAVFMAADLFVEDHLAVRGTLCFGASRASISGMPQASRCLPADNVSPYLRADMYQLSSRSQPMTRLKHQEAVEFYQTVAPLQQETIR